MREVGDAWWRWGDGGGLVTWEWVSCVGFPEVFCVPIWSNSQSDGDREYI